jgi:hypothetical protein
VQIAEGLFEEAKGWKAGEIEKNRIAVFDECLPWREGTGELGLSTLISIADKLMDAVRIQEVSKSLVHS